VLTDGFQLLLLLLLLLLSVHLYSDALCQAIE